MRYRRIWALIVSVLIAGTAAAQVGTGIVFAEEKTEVLMTVSAAFEGYVHDPMKNPDAAKDIIPDPNAVYGYSPDPKSPGLGTYAKFDFSDPDVVAGMRKQREDYHESMKELYQIISDMKAEGRTAEEIARRVSTRRNEIRLEQYKDDPAGLAEVKARNLEKYGNENGPTPEYLYQRYGTWEIVTNKALSPNQGADACLGLYDEYYDTYELLDDGKKWSDDFNYYVLNGRTYYKYDTLANGLTVIDGSTYYFADGVMKTGAVKSGGKLYYFFKSGKGRAAKGWFKGSDGKKRYSLGSGRIAAGVRKIGKTYYFFNTGSGLLHKKGFFKSGGSEYYSKGSGKLATGWTAVGKKACYFYKSGKKACSMAKSTRIGHLKVPKSGRLGEAYALGIKALNKHGWSLKKAYRFSYRLKYYDRWYRRSSSEKYALRGFKAHHGNCYVMAATFYIQAKLLGYDVHQVRGKVGIWPHSWTEIKHGRKTYVYDPNFRNETGRNGWKIWYGKKGTWRYSHRHRMN